MKKSKQILFASNNRGKYDELADDFKTVGLDLVYYADVGLPKLVLPEDYNTLAENAKEKAQEAAKATGYYTLGDDSGLFINALSGFPGVYSRRWYAESNDDASRNSKIIEMMKDKKDRSAHLISRFSLSDPSGNEIFKTVVNNEFTIADSISGTKGFGYDSILLPSSFNVFNANLSDSRKYEILASKETIADLTQEEKNAINNRGRIAQEIRDFFDKEKGDENDEY